MFSTALHRAALAGVLVASGVVARAQSPRRRKPRCIACSSPTASTLVSYGEFARVADRVVLSLPLGGTPAAPRLQLLSIPATSVDWDRTDAYAEAARAARFAATRGPDQYALLQQAWRAR